MSQPSTSGLPFSVVFGWGLGSLGLATILNTLNILLVAYLTLVVGLEPAWAGTLVLLIKVYDVLTDLPMGYITDRTHTSWGARRPYLLVATLLTPVSLWLLFAPGDGVVLALLLYATGYTLFNVPYLSMPAELAPDLSVRTRMISWRSAFIAAGTFFGIAVAPFLVGWAGGGEEGYRLLGLVMAAFVAAAFGGCFWLTGRVAPAPAQPRTLSFGEQLRIVGANSHFRALMLIKVTHLLALAVGAGSLVFFFSYALGYDLKILGLYGAVTTAAWAISMPFWSRLANSRGKRYGYFVATLGYTVMTATWWFAEAGEPMPLLLARAAGFGVISGGMLLMGNAMLQDVMDEDYRVTGSRKNGLFAGLYSLIEKLTSGIGAQILGLVLSYTGFNSAATEQAPEAISGLYIVIALIPAVLMLVSLFAIYAYRLDEQALKMDTSHSG